MDPHVYLQAASLRESLVTFLAGMWFFASVNTIVLLLAARLGESPFTLLTGMWCIPSVNPNMSLQVTIFRKSLVAFIAELRRHWTSDFHGNSLLCN